jgi:hypothetical protein
MGGHIDINDKVDGHISADPHTHIHWHLDELFFAGSEGVLSSVSEADQDIVIRNPTGSGMRVELIYYQATASIGFEGSKYFNVTYPETSGTPDGTEVTPFCLSNRDQTATFEVQHTPIGDSINLVDESTADRQVPSAVVGGTRQNPTPFEVQGSTIGLDPGETFLIRTTLDNSGEDIAHILLVAEYEQGRDIE